MASENFIRYMVEALSCTAADIFVRVVLRDDFGVLSIFSSLAVRWNVITSKSLCNGQATIPTVVAGIPLELCGE